MPRILPQFLAHYSFSLSLPAKLTFVHFGMSHMISFSSVEERVAQVPENLESIGCDAMETWTWAMYERLVERSQQKIEAGQFDRYDLFISTMNKVVQQVALEVDRQYLVELFHFLMYDDGGFEGSVNVEMYEEVIDNSVEHLELEEGYDALVQLDYLEWSYRNAEPTKTMELAECRTYTKSKIDHGALDTVCLQENYFE
ncbi:hypothetical protein KP509_23G026800 [Ceratopteris richardii]|uniref:Uncharacterized protein n=1 Tax=Ceratopteris richardii TaxID=49495 RepID=A0A8T2S1C6_CERRI|nr:hypothetical protein KP509_23G026800 [Ceratopteris richardii]